MRAKRLDPEADARTVDQNRRVRVLFAGRIVQGLLMILFLLSIAWILSGHWPGLSEAGARAASEGPEIGQTGPRAFSIEGEDMSQFLMAFGSERLAAEVVDLKLNCESLILREEILGKTAVLDVKLSCECLDPESEENDVEYVQGDWQVIVHR